MRNIKEQTPERGAWSKVPYLYASHWARASERDGMWYSSTSWQKRGHSLWTIRRCWTGQLGGSVGGAQACRAAASHSSSHVGTTRPSSLKAAGLFPLIQRNGVSSCNILPSLT